jgi:hypothetical protein
VTKGRAPAGARTGNNKFYFHIAFLKTDPDSDSDTENMPGGDIYTPGNPATNRFPISNSNKNVI